MAAPAEEPAVVTIVKRKRPEGTRSWRGYVVAVDERGTWVFTPAGSTHTGTDRSGLTSTCEVAQDDQGRGRHSIVLLPHAAWFVAHWVLDSEYVVHVDIATPPARSGAVWSFDDLELDPLLLQDGSFVVDDEDEFAAACADGRISGTEREAALLAVEALRIEFVSGALVTDGRDHLRASAARPLARL
ncbi:DUF402 domain-containing protein [Curtobacterium sp. MCBA15_008]|uniref:DUF402 domain-containing protein n=1 Tax=Curtobacterium sp. MCBA15_008 TaxID=1898736 RepID=UPI0008DE177E|nr:DUF402 domain-containing protein [Curtobacterium sp. MCBA15_008]OII05430.1 hypothetical protein BIU96_07330 [Curtobacterium sp. MCBA15_008]